MRSHSKALFAVAALFAFLVLAPIAQAAPKGVIGTFGEPGGAGDQFGSPAGVAVNQTTGDVFVADAPGSGRSGQRIVQFDEDGEFVRAWGKDVVQAGGPGDVPTPPIVVNERQTARLFGRFDPDCFCQLLLTGGTFTLSFDGQTTAPIPHDASLVQVQAALETLSNIDTVIVTDEVGPNVGWTVEFTGTLGGTDVPTMTADASGLEPSGSSGFVQGEQDGFTTSNGPAEVCTLASSCQGGLAGTGASEFSLGSSQLAIDQTDGSLYVADTQNHRIQKFSSNGTFIDEFGTNGSGNGEFSSPKGVGVDPASGDLYVADTDNHRIQRFGGDGTFLSEIQGLGGSSDGEFFAPTRVAVDSTGRLYVLDSGNSRIQRFTNTGAFDQVFAPGSYSSPADLAIDPATDNVLIAGSSADSSISGILEFNPSGTLLDTHAPSVGLSPGGLLVHSSTGRIYVSDSPNSRVAILDFVTSPSVTIEPVTPITANGATFNGKVNPEGPPNVSYRFEYSEDGTNWVPVPENEVPLGEGTVDIAVTQSVSGLDPNTEYRVRLVSRKDFNAGSVTSSEVTFITDPALPVLRPPLPAAVVTENSAWLGAEIDPRKAPTTFYVEYTTENDPGFANSTSVPASQDAFVGSGKGFVMANQLVEGLESSTTYLFQVVATNAGGTVTGESRSFTTLAEAPLVQGLPDGRVWEKVSPAYKAGAHISPVNQSVDFPITAFRSQAASHGDAVTFASEGKFAGESGPPFSQYLAKRGTDGWVTEGITPPLTPSGDIQNINYYQWFGEDLTWGVVTTNAALSPGDPEKLGSFNLYYRDNETKAYRRVSDMGMAEMVFRGASEDGTTVVFGAGSGAGAFQKLVKRTGNGDAIPVGILPDQTEVPVGLGNAPVDALYSVGFNPVSANGSRIYFKPFLDPRALYLREGDTTTLISGSERSGDVPSQPQPAIFLGASKNGSIAFFSSKHRLTDGSKANPECVTKTGDLLCGQLYRWDANAPEGERLTDLTTVDPLGSEVLGMTGISEDGTSAYFVAAGDVIGDGDRDPKLYLWREGEGISLVADAADLGLWGNLLLGGGGGEFRHARVSPDGRFLAFQSRAQLTSYDTSDTIQLYLYDSFVKKLTCVSCGTVSLHSRADSLLLSSMSSETNGDGNEKLTANLSPDGRRLIFDSKDALVPEDTNGALDVYEWQEGRLHLLSSGTAATASRFLDASEDLDDVFFTTEQRLVRSDQDSLRDVYDARVGGVPEPNGTPPCVADECQGTPIPPPNFQTPSSASFQGAGNAADPKPRCAKGKVRRKGRCVKRRARKAKSQRTKRANTNGRTGR